MIQAVIDTNVLLSSIAKLGETRWLYNSFANEEFCWVFSNEILTEYTEMLCWKYTERTAEIVTSVLLIAENTRRFEPTYKYQLIEIDPDDNKFVDCAIGTNVDCLVTADKHILELRKIQGLFPPVPILNPIEFRRLLDSMRYKGL